MNTIHRLLSTAALGAALAAPALAQGGPGSGAGDQDRSRSDAASRPAGSRSADETFSLESPGYPSRPSDPSRSLERPSVPPRSGEAAERQGERRRRWWWQRDHADAPRPGDEPELERRDESDRSRPGATGSQRSGSGGDITR